MMVTVVVAVVVVLAAVGVDEGNCGDSVDQLGMVCMFFASSSLYSSTFL